MKTAYVFQRFEKKYRINQEQKNRLLHAAASAFVPDVFAKNTICSLYLDTPDHLLIRNSLDAKGYKEKIRLRSYCTPSEDSIVFLEIKKKYEGIVYKRRIDLPLQAAMRYVEHGILPRKDQIALEIDYSMQYYHHPLPRMLIAYEREAYYVPGHESLRLTFDTSIRYRDRCLDMKKGSYGIPLLSEEEVLLEVKTSGAMPLWLSHTLDHLGVFPCSFSKYGNAYLSSVQNQSIKINDREGFYVNAV